MHSHRAGALRRLRRPQAHAAGQCRGSGGSRLLAGAALAVAAGLASLAPPPLAAVAGPPVTTGGLAGQVAALEASLVSTGRQLHQLAVDTAAAAGQLRAATAALGATQRTLVGLRGALEGAELRSRQLALATYMDDGSAGTASAFAAIEHGSSTELAARQAYAAMASETWSTAIDRYRHLRVVLAERLRQEAADQAAATTAYETLADHYRTLEQTAAHEQAMLDTLRQEEAADAAAAAAAARAAAAPAVVPTTVLIGPSGSLAEDLARLRQCESGDDYQADTGNGYYGAYQFSLSTWDGLGYSGLPSQAPPPEQDQAAITLEQRSGWSQWPVCAALLGLD